MTTPIYILGHKNPDADAICSALAYEAYKHATGQTEYIAARCGNSNARIDAILDRFKVDLPVFRLPDGTVSKNLHQTFRAFVTETGLIKCPRTAQNRTLYSLRHTYATFSLLNDGMDIHALAIQMGTSIGMIERHYSHLTPRLKKDMLTGKRYELSYADYKAQQASG